MKDQRFTPMIVAVEMGYGHLRPAYVLADSFGTEVVRMDIPPVAGPVETALWAALLKAYGGISRACDWPAAGSIARRALEIVTEITPLGNHEDEQPANAVTHLASLLAGTVFGRRFRTMVSSAGIPVITTYPAAAHAASRVGGSQVFCLATDTDLNRAWAPVHAGKAGIEYFAPVERVVERLRSFGVPDHKIHLTGFPLPEKLVENARHTLMRRLRRLDPESSFLGRAYPCIDALSPHIAQPVSRRSISMTVAIGGAGAQTGQAGQIIRSLRGRVLEGKLRVTVVAGIRPAVAATLREMVQSAGLAAQIHHGIEILQAGNLEDYFRQFDDCLAETDVLWTKPSELVFYASLGLPILMAPPVGGQEHANREWLLSRDAALDAGEPSKLDVRLKELLATGELCRVAWNAYSNLQQNGLESIRNILNEVIHGRKSHTLLKM